jgi:hypothetical protein
MAGHIDLTGHETADAYNAAHDQDLEIQPFLRENPFFLAVIQVDVTQRRSRDTDVETIGGPGIGNERKAKRQ